MFKIRTFPKKNMQWWHSKVNQIDFDPDFQRKPQVWAGKDRQFLIDSILNGYDVPKFYIANFTKHDVPSLNKRKKKYAIIDGKQRLTAINGFIDDELRLSKKFKLLSDPQLQLGNMSFSELRAAHPAIAQRVLDFSPDVKSIETDEREKINEVFLRLNKASTALNGAEVRNAMIGKAVDSIRSIAKHKFFENRIKFQTNRSQERNAAAKILVLEYNGGAFVDTKKKNLDAFVTEVGAGTSSKFNKTMKRVKTKMDALADVFERTDPLLSAQGHVPLYYVFISALKAAEKKKVRAFLLRFEDDRRINRNDKRHIKDLDDYDLASRSTNDKTAFKTRLRIIRKRFHAWTKTREGQDA